MQAIDAFKKSAAWSEEHNLPLVPDKNNPFIYMAYAFEIIGPEGEILCEEAIDKYLGACEKDPGAFTRWPDGSGGQTSWDELVGIAYLDKHAAKRIVYYLAEHDGEYNISGEGSFIPERFNLYRFPFLLPYLKACAGMNVNLVSQIIWASLLIFDGLTWKQEKGLGGLLSSWIMTKRMDKFPICNFAIWLFKRNMQGRGVGPKYCFEYYLADYPVFRENAPENF